MLHPNWNKGYRMERLRQVLVRTRNILLRNLVTGSIHPRQLGSFETNKILFLKVMSLPPRDRFSEPPSQKEREDRLKMCLTDSNSSNNPYLCPTSQPPSRPRNSRFRALPAPSKARIISASGRAAGGSTIATDRRIRIPAPLMVMHIS